MGVDQPDPPPPRPAAAAAGRSPGRTRRRGRGRGPGTRRPAVPPPAAPARPGRRRRTGTAPAAAAPAAPPAPPPRRRESVCSSCRTAGGSAHAAYWKPKRRGTATPRRFVEAAPRQTAFRPRQPCAVARRTGPTPPSPSGARLPRLRNDAAHRRGGVDLQHEILRAATAEERKQGVVPVPTRRSPPIKKNPPRAAFRSAKAAALSVKLRMSVEFPNPATVKLPSLVPVPRSAKAAGLKEPLSCRSAAGVETSNRP